MRGRARAGKLGRQLDLRIGSGTCSLLGNPADGMAALPHNPSPASRAAPSHRPCLSRHTSATPGSWAHTCAQLAKCQGDGHTGGDKAEHMALADGGQAGEAVGILGGQVAQLPSHQAALAAQRGVGRAGAVRLGVGLTGSMWAAGEKRVLTHSVRQAGRQAQAPPPDP